MSQDKLTQPRAYSAFWSAPASDERGVSSDSVTVCWLERGQHKGKLMFNQQLGVLFGDPTGAVEWECKGVVLSIALKVALSKCVRMVCFFAVLMDIWEDKR